MSAPSTTAAEGIGRGWTDRANRTAAELSKAIQAPGLFHPRCVDLLRSNLDRATFEIRRWGREVARDAALSDPFLTDGADQ